MIRHGVSLGMPRFLKDLVLTRNVSYLSTSEGISDNGSGWGEPVGAWGRRCQEVRVVHRGASWRAALLILGSTRFSGAWFLNALNDDCSSPAVC